jgi:hypothetical protein
MPSAIACGIALERSLCLRRARRRSSWREAGGAHALVKSLGSRAILAGQRALAGTLDSRPHRSASDLRGGGVEADFSAGRTPSLRLLADQTAEVLANPA